MEASGLWLPLCGMGPVPSPSSAPSFPLWSAVPPSSGGLWPPRCVCLGWWGALALLACGAGLRTDTGSVLKPEGLLPCPRLPCPSHPADPSRSLSPRASPRTSRSARFKGQKYTRPTAQCHCLIVWCRLVCGACPTQLTGVLPLQGPLTSAGAAPVRLGAPESLREPRPRAPETSVLAARQDGLQVTRGSGQTPSIFDDSRHPESKQLASSAFGFTKACLIQHPFDGPAPVSRQEARGRERTLGSARLRQDCAANSSTKCNCDLLSGGPTTESAGHMGKTPFLELSTFWKVCDGSREGSHGCPQGTKDSRVFRLRSSDSDQAELG